MANNLSESLSGGAGEISFSPTPMPTSRAEATEEHYKKFKAIDPTLPDVKAIEEFTLLYGRTPEPEEIEPFMQQIGLGKKFTKELPLEQVVQPPKGNMFLGK